MNKTVSILIAFLIIFLTGCSADTHKHTAQLPCATYMIDSDTIAEVCSILESNGLKNTSIYRNWVIDFSETSAKKAGLPERWTALSNPDENLYLCADYWEKTHNYSDVNCRMTAMLLMGDLLRIDNPEKTYSGTYLMMDADAIENAAEYSVLKERESDFTTLFGEMSIPESGLADALPQNWQKHGIRFNSEKVSLISVVIEDTMSPVAFVGHAGLLINEDDYLLFVEKLAFEQPYQVTKLNNVEELISMLSARPEYAAEDGKEQSVICQNDIAIGRIDANHSLN